MSELQIEIERHRKTWTQLEQVTGLLREIIGALRSDRDLGLWQCRMNEADRWEREAATLSQQAEPALAQDEREPVGWYTDDHLTDKSATTYDREVADRWRGKGWPVYELYARPAQTEQQPEQSNLEPLLNAGAALSNIAYNLAQRPGVTLDQIVCDTLSSARKSWDAARAAMDAKEE